MEALAKLQGLYDQRTALDTQIKKIEELLGADPAAPKQKRTRGPNKKKEPPPNML
jgi:hypothetical protein